MASSVSKVKITTFCFVVKTQRCQKTLCVFELILKSRNLSIWSFFAHLISRSLKIFFSFSLTSAQFQKTRKIYLFDHSIFWKLLIISCKIDWLLVTCPEWLVSFEYPQTCLKTFLKPYLRDWVKEWNTIFKWYL